MAEGLEPKHPILSQGGQCSSETTSLPISALVTRVLDRDKYIRQGVGKFYDGLFTEVGER